MLRWLAKTGRDKLGMGNRGREWRRLKSRMGWTIIEEEEAEEEEDLRSPEENKLLCVDGHI